MDGHSPGSPPLQGRAFPRPAGTPSSGGPLPSHLPTLDSAHPIGLELCSDHPQTLPAGGSHRRLVTVLRPPLYPEPLRPAAQELRLLRPLPPAQRRDSTNPGVAQTCGHALALVTCCVTVPEPPALSGSHPLLWQVGLSLTLHRGAGGPGGRLCTPSGSDLGRPKEERCPWPAEPGNQSFHPSAWAQAGDSQG